MLLSPRFLLAAALLVGAQPGLAQDSRPPGALTTPSETAQEDPEISDEDLNQALLAEQEAFEPLENRWTNAVQGHYFECQELRKAGATPAEFPPHPVHEYFPVFNALAEGGNGPATLWLIRAAKEVVEDEEERTAFYQDLFLTLANDHASGKYIQDALVELRNERRTLGEPFVIDVLHRIQNNSRRRGTIANAFLAEANLLAAKGGLEDPERRARAEELWRILVDGYPGTEAAKFAGTPLVNGILDGMRRSQIEWAAEVGELRAAGTPEAEWPALPGLSDAAVMATISGAGHPFASQWANRFYPGMEQALREGLDEALAFEVAWLWRRFGARSVAWNELRFSLLRLLYEAYPDSQAAASTLPDLFKRVQELDIEGPVSLLEGLAAATSEPSLRAEAQLTLAQFLTRSQTLAGLEQATANFAQAEASAPDPDQRSRARELGLSFSWTMPGAVSPAFNLMDSEQAPVSSASYRGKILLLYFWTLNVPGVAEDFPFVHDLVERYADAPVSVLGIGSQTMDQKMYRAAMVKHDINWRNCMLQKRRNHIAAQYGVSEFPHLIVIDADGIIRGRALGHEGTLALVDELIAEQRRNEALAENAGGVTGRIRFVGEVEPLPPIEIPKSAEIPCGSRTRELDRTDRTLLLSEQQGVANVVLTIRTEQTVPSRAPGRAVLEGVRCRFEPHVTVVPVGTRVSVTNGDQIPRNMQAKSLSNGSFNVVLPPGVGYDLDLKVPDRFKVTSDTHAWMSAWVVVTDAPFWAVTDADGSFTVDGLPPGRYVAEWWHETLGRGETAEFEVPAKGMARLEHELGAK